MTEGSGASGSEPVSGEEDPLADLERGTPVERDQVVDGDTWIDLRCVAACDLPEGVAGSGDVHCLGRGAIGGGRGAGDERRDADRRTTEADDEREQAADHHDGPTDEQLPLGRRTGARPTRIGDDGERCGRTD